MLTAHAERQKAAIFHKLETIIQGEYFFSEALCGHFSVWLKKKMGFYGFSKNNVFSNNGIFNSFLSLVTMPLMNSFLSYFCVKKISLSRRDEYVVDGSMDQ